MRRLRHPIRSIREPFGTAGLIVACVALIAAVGGSAFAATKLNGTQKKEVRTIAKAEAKKFAGGQGPAGPQGPAGSQGAAGKNGTNGTNGTNGAPGAPGTSATTQTFTGVKGACTEGGITVKSASPEVNVCNGEKGDPAEFPDTLPPGKTLTGFWTDHDRHASDVAEPHVEISYPIRLAERSEKVVILDLTETEGSTTTPVEGCEYEIGNVEAAPVAPPGQLCIFTTEEIEGKALFTLIPGSFGEEGDTPAGTLLWTATSVFAGSQAEIAGVWAVTAAEP